MQGTDQDCASAGVRQRPGQGGEIGEITDAPRPAAPQRVDLRRHSPCNGDLRTGRWIDDQVGFGPAVDRCENVVADRHVGGQGEDFAHLRAIFEYQPTRIPQRVCFAAGDEPHRRPRLRRTHRVAQ